MKRKASVILFGASFLIAILGEVYLLNVLEPRILSIMLIGIVIIITGYLFFESIGEYISYNINNRELIREEFQRQEAVKWDIRYTELLNIQKAAYAALKKSDIKMQEELKELSDRMEQIIQLQNKIMEGQKKALNISVNYNTEHTKELTQRIKEECAKINYEKQLSSILSMLQNHQASSGTANKVEAHEEEKAELEITPLYDDPNATLSADEIANLFKNYGK